MEIGSIFEIDVKRLFEDSDCNEVKFPFMMGDWNSEFFNTGRAAIEAFFISYKDIRKVWLPSFICTSVIDAIKRAGKEICYYPVLKSLQPDINYLKGCTLDKNDVLYVMQYFGVTLSEDFIQYINLQRARSVLVFEDITMSLLSCDSQSFAIGDYVLGSIRKWDAIPDGAFLSSRNHFTEHEKKEASYDYTMYYFAAQVMKSVYLENSSMFDKEKFLSLSSLGIESLFSDFTIRKMSEISYRMIRKQWMNIAQKRKENYDVLYDLLEKIPGICIPNKCKPHMIPIGMFLLTDKRDALLNYLISKDIYCNVHWRQNEGTEFFEDSAYLSRHCLTIPCDHRYNEKHMEYIYKSLKSFMEDS